MARRKRMNGGNGGNGGADATGLWWASVGVNVSTGREYAPINGAGKTALADELYDDIAERFHEAMVAAGFVTDGPMILATIYRGNAHGIAMRETAPKRAETPAPVAAPAPAPAPAPTAPATGRKRGKRAESPKPAPAPETAPTGRKRAAKSAPAPAPKSATKRGYKTGANRPKIAGKRAG